MSEIALPWLWLMGFGAAVAIYFGIVIGFDIARHRRLKRMEAEASRTFLGVEISAQAGTEKESTAVGMIHPAAPPPGGPVEADGVSTDKHTGAGGAPGDAKLGPGVTVLPDPTRCAHCHHYHLHVGSLLCEACEASKGGAA